MIVSFQSLTPAGGWERTNPQGLQEGLITRTLDGLHQSVGVSEQGDREEMAEQTQTVPP